MKTASLSKAPFTGDTEFRNAKPLFRVARPGHTDSNSLLPEPETCVYTTKASVDSYSELPKITLIKKSLNFLKASSAKQAVLVPSA